MIGAAIRIVLFAVAVYYGPAALSWVMGYLPWGWQYFARQYGLAIWIGFWALCLLVPVLQDERLTRKIRGPVKVVLWAAFLTVLAYFAPLLRDQAMPYLSPSWRQAVRANWTGGPSIYAGLVFPLVCLLVWRLRPRPRIFGSARWLTLWRAVWTGMISPLPKGVLVGDWKTWALLPVFYRGDASILTVGPPGSRKGVGMLIPNALRLPFQFIVDPGGEITAVCMKEWRRKRYNVYCINPWGMHAKKPWRLPSHSFNPLDGIDPTSKTFASDADLQAEMMIKRTGQERDPVWNDRGQEMLKIAIMHIKTFEPPSRQNLLTLRSYFMSGPDDWKRLLRTMKDNHADPAIARAAANWEREEGASAKMFIGFLDVAVRATAFVEDQVIRDGIINSDVPFGELKGRDANGRRIRGTIITVVIPLQYLQSHAAYVKLAMGCAMAALLKGRLPRAKVWFLVDEFAALGRMENVKKAMATFRKYRVILHVVFQSVGQMKELYENGWATTEDTCELRQFIAAWSADTSEHVSRLLGTSTLVYEDRPMSRILLMPDEVRQLSENKQIVFLKNKAACMLSVRPYWERPSLNGRYYDNPYHKRTPNPPAAWPVQALLGFGLRVTGWVLGPSKTFAVMVLLSVLWALK